MMAALEANPLDQCIVASVQMSLRSCFMWNPKAPKDVQLWAKGHCNMVGGERLSFREHLAEGWLAGRLHERSHEGELREGRLVIPPSSFQPCAAQVP